jgi:hypothetical protein
VFLCVYFHAWAHFLSIGLLMCSGCIYLYVYTYVCMTICLCMTIDGFVQSVNVYTLTQNIYMCVCMSTYMNIPTCTCVVVWSTCGSRMHMCLVCQMAGTIHSCMHDIERRRHTHCTARTREAAASPLSPCVCLSRNLGENQITTLPAGVFQGLTSLLSL